MSALQRNALLTDGDVCLRCGASVELPADYCGQCAVDKLIARLVDAAWREGGAAQVQELHEAKAAIRSEFAALYAAAERALNYIENTESEFGIKLDSGDMLRAALKLARGGA